MNRLADGETNEACEVKPPVYAGWHLGCGGRGVRCVVRSLEIEPLGSNKITSSTLGKYASPGERRQFGEKSEGGFQASVSGGRSLRRREACETEKPRWLVEWKPEKHGRISERRSGGRSGCNPEVAVRGAKESRRCAAEATVARQGPGRCGVSPLRGERRTK